jgi:Helix-turn-helix domain
VTQDDLLYRFRLRVFAMAAGLGNVRAACRAMGIHPSTYYRWKRQLERHGPQIMRPRERRSPRMANPEPVDLGETGQPGNCWGCSSGSMGLLIHTTSGSRGGWGGLPTNRWGWAAKAASSTEPLARVICAARP